MAKKKTAKRRARARAGADRKTFVRALGAEEKEMVAKFNAFMDAWKDHVHEEISIHKRLLQGRENFDAHLKETVGIHKKFINRISRL